MRSSGLKKQSTVHSGHSRVMMLFKVSMITGASDLGGTLRATVSAGNQELSFESLDGCIALVEQVLKRILTPAFQVQSSYNDLRHCMALLIELSRRVKTYGSTSCICAVQMSFVDVPFRKYSEEKVGRSLQAQ
jgi:hypothetical protein